jgi:hypothetical protein
MLKIYLAKLKCELHIKNKIKHIGEKTYYTILDESDADTKTKEFSVYSDDATQLYRYVGPCAVYNKRKGMVAVYEYFLDTYTIKEWVDPDAKLVANLSYKEHSCSMEKLMTLPATDVIAYFKQEGLCFQN